MLFLTCTSRHRSLTHQDSPPCIFKSNARVGIGARNNITCLGCGWCKAKPNRESFSHSITSNWAMGALKGGVSRSMGRLSGRPVRPFSIIAKGLIFHFRLVSASPSSPANHHHHPRRQPRAAQLTDDNLSTLPDFNYRAKILKMFMQRAALTAARRAAVPVARRTFATSLVRCTYSRRRWS